MAKTIDQLTALAATPDDSADTLLISDAGVTKKITAGNLKGDCIRAEKNNALDSSNGTKIGTNANQLLGFWNATPVDQPAVTADLLDSLQEVGLIASGAGDTPLNLSAGALTCGPIAAGAGSVISGTDNSNAALRVTQTGTGHSLLVEDSTNPDATPFVVTNSGRVVIGNTEASATVDYNNSSVTDLLQTAASGSYAGASIQNYVAGSGASHLSFARSRSGSLGTHTVVNNNDRIGHIIFQGSDGSAFVRSSQIHGAVDGTPSAGSVPGRLLLSTAEAGSATPTERMRITSAGNVGINTASPTARLTVAHNDTTDAVRITQEGSGNALVIEDSTNPDATPFVVNAGGSVVRGHTAIIDTSQGTPTFQCVGSDTSSSGLTAFAFFSSTGTRRPMLEFARSKTNTIGTHTIVGPSDNLGSIRASGSDGVKFVAAAAINFVADGTPGVDDMPGAILLATTADGANATTERMRIDSAGNVGIGTTANAAALLDVSSTTKGFLPPRMTGAQRDAISTPPAGLMVYNTTTNKLNFYNGSAWEAVTSS
jgi:hypothetical protein